jgi:hypothetical protein
MGREEERKTKRIMTEMTEMTERGSGRAKSYM